VSLRALLGANPPVEERSESDQSVVARRYQTTKSGRKTLTGPVGWENMDSDRRGDVSSGPPSDTTVPLDVLPLHSTNLLTVLDEDGVVQYESPSIERIYGYGQDELVGEQVIDYFHPDDRERVATAYRAVVTGEEGAVETVEYRHERADGGYTWVESVASANPTPDGNYVVNTRDISDRKEREEHLERTNERLEEFASVVSHDLRNPLNVAQGRLELARDECESEHLADVARAHDRMEALIDRLLTLSRIGERTTEREPVDIAALSETCWATVPTADATLVTDTNSRLCADRSRLRRLLENLFRNAVEHGSTSPDSQARQDGVMGSDSEVTVTVGDLDRGFYVEDDGPGIPESKRRQVFEAGNSTATGGTGLGLSIVEQIVEAHGWEIRVTDGTDGGARFEVTAVEVIER
jgi:PAS domain S-box-containing protein